MHIKKFLIVLFLILISCPVLAAEQTDFYADYLKRLEKTETETDIAKNGFTVIEDQCFLVEFESLGLLNFIPALDEKYGRMILFFSDTDGRVVYKTDQLASNSWNKGQMKQPNRDVTAVAYRDLNDDGLKDIVIICSCMNETGDYAQNPYKVGDVLFQNSRGFYKDWRLTDKMNRFSMHKNIEVITAFVRDGQSAEFLYTARTLDELLRSGFKTIENQSFEIDFEKYGRVQVIPGSYNIAGHYIFMIYVVDSKGLILRNFQPMGAYDNFNQLKGISFRDVDGDGLKDVTVLVSYYKIDKADKTLGEDDFFIYYQRAAYFYEDVAFKKSYTATGTETLDEIIQKAREYWAKEGVK